MTGGKAAYRTTPPRTRARSKTPPPNRQQKVVPKPSPKVSSKKQIPRPKKKAACNTAASSTDGEHEAAYRPVAQPPAPAVIAQTLDGDEEEVVVDDFIENAISQVFTGPEDHASSILVYFAVGKKMKEGNTRMGQ